MEAKPIETAFSETQQLHIYPPGIDRNFWHIARNRLIAYYLKRYKAEPILEIGAGAGIVVHALRQKGFQIEGVEKAVYTAPIPGVPVRYGVEAFELPAAEKSRYQAVALFDVIEHLPDRITFLRQIRAHFSGIRYLYLTVPAFPELFSNYDEFSGHYLRYLMDTLGQELYAAGYQVVYQRYFFHALYWAIRATISAQRKRATEFHPPKGISRLIHALIGQMFFYEGRFLPRKWRGSSLLCIASPV